MDGKQYKKSAGTPKHPGKAVQDHKHGTRATGSGRSSGCPSTTKSTAKSTVTRSVGSKPLVSMATAQSAVSKPDVRNKGEGHQQKHRPESSSLVRNEDHEPMEEDGRPNDVIETRHLKLDSWAVMFLTEAMREELAALEVDLNVKVRKIAVDQLRIDGSPDNASKIDSKISGLCKKIPDYQDVDVSETTIEELAQRVDRISKEFQNTQPPFFYDFSLRDRRIRIGRTFRIGKNVRVMSPSKLHSVFLTKPFWKSKLKDIENEDSTLIRQDGESLFFEVRCEQVERDCKQKLRNLFAEMDQIIRQSEKIDLSQFTLDYISHNLAAVEKAYKDIHLHTSLNDATTIIFVFNMHDMNAVKEMLTLDRGGTHTSASGSNSGVRTREAFCQTDGSLASAGSNASRSGRVERFSTEITATPQNAAVSGPRYEHVFGNCMKLVVYVGNIVREDVDAIVNAANDRLDHGGGVSRAIAMAAGPGFQKESYDFIRRHGPVRLSHVAVTSSGNLPSGYVLHAVGPTIQHPNYDTYLEKTFKCVFKECGSLGIRNVAIPALSTGINGVPVEVFADTFLKALVSFVSKYPASSLQEIRLVDIDQTSVREFIRLFERAFPNNYLTAIATGMAPPDGRIVRSELRASTAYSPTAASQATAAPSGPPDDECPICLCAFVNITKTKCGHEFCKDCLDQCLKTSGNCPVCKTIIKRVRGNQPKQGRMTNHRISNPLPGYTRCDTIQIDYYFPDGIQEENHPSPGRRYYGTSRTAFLPGNLEGQQVLRLLERAFDDGLIFTIGRSSTTGIDDCVIWNDVHHKTHIHGGPQSYGYPDPTYLSRVKSELAAKGIK